MKTWILALFLVWPSTGQEEIVHHFVRADSRSACVDAQYFWRRVYRRDGAEGRIADCWVKA